MNDESGGMGAAAWVAIFAGLGLLAWLALGAAGLAALGGM
jgi:hypothetical protein